MSVTIQSNKYYHYGNSNTVVVLVHGWNSSEACWNDSKAGRNWCDIIRDDDRLSDVSVFVFGYSTTMFGETSPTSAIAEQLYAACINPVPTLEGRSLRPVLEHENIIFVGHSQGGLVIRNLLVRRLESSIHAARIGLLTLGTPAKGARFASWAKPIASWIGNRQLLALSRYSDELVSLHDEFEYLKFQFDDRLHGAEIIESVSYKNKAFRAIALLAPGLRLVVDESTQGEYFGSPIHAADCDHSTLAAIGHPNHPSHQALLDLYREHFQEFYHPGVTDTLRSEIQLLMSANLIKPSRTLVLADVKNWSSKSGRQVRKKIDDAMLEMEDANGVEIIRHVVADKYLLLMSTRKETAMQRVLHRQRNKIIFIDSEPTSFSVRFVPARCEAKTALELAQELLELLHIEKMLGN